MDLQSLPTSVLWPALGLAALAFIVWARRLDRSGASTAGPGRSPEGPGAAPLDVLELMQRGRKIDAIKLYREEHGVGLREAKEAVEALAEGRTG